MTTTEEVAARVTRAGLEGDGVASHLFELLWKRDLLNDSSLALRIPDTVIFKYNAPSVWYFTSVDGTIKRKCKIKVNTEQILHEFRKRASPSGIAACYIKTVPDDSPEAGGEASISTRTTLEYLDIEGLEEFLSDRQREKHDGILQKFIEPKSGRNNMLRAMWSPKVCLLERRVNHLRVNDSRYDIYERAVTFEGADCHSEVTPVRGPALVSKVHEIAGSIVQHVAAVTNDRLKISRLALNFKADDRDRLWLLFASSVRLRDEFARGRSVGPADVQALERQGLSNTPLEANTVLQVPDHIRPVRSTSHAAPASLQQTRTCPTCRDKVEPGCLFDISYKVLVEYDEQRQAARRQAEGLEEEVSGDAVEVPEVLHRLHPRLTAEEYARYRNDVAFLWKAASVCESCFLRFSKPQLGLSSAVPLANTQRGHVYEESIRFVQGDDLPLGMQRLDPERLRRRRHVTRQRISDRQALEEEWWEEQAREKAQASEKMWRAKSCPKLSCSSPVARPPPPTLSVCPKPPKETAPFWSTPQTLRRCEPAEPQPPRRRRRVPALRGEPYLREVQNFAARCAGRAAEVLGPAAFEAAAQAVSLYYPDEKRNEEPSSQTQPQQQQQLQQQQRQPQSPHQHPQQQQQRQSRRSPSLQRPPLAVPEEDSDVEVFEEESEGDPIVSELWGKWPPSCRTRSATPTTRTPSGPSSQRCSRPSTHCSSRGKSPAAAAAPRRLSRPLSSPQVGRAAPASPQRRRASSPGGNPGFQSMMSLRARPGTEGSAPRQPRTLQAEPVEAAASETDSGWDSGRQRRGSATSK